MKTVAFHAIWSALVLACLAQAAAGASGCASRRVVAPEQTIVGVLFDLGLGGAAGLLEDAGQVDFQSAPGRIRQLAETVQVQIDGRPASGLCGWLQATVRIAGYARAAPAPLHVADIAVPLVSKTVVYSAASLESLPFS